MHSQYDWVATRATERGAGLGSEATERGRSCPVVWAGKEDAAHSHRALGRCSGVISICLTETLPLYWIDRS